MNKRGFTLIELLAVIVILAIIALIATPIVLNIINESKESAQIRSAEMYLKGVETSVASAIIHEKNVTDGEHPIMPEGDVCLGTLQVSNETTTCNGEVLEVEMNGEIPTSGTVTIESGKIKDIAFTYSNGKTIVKKSDGKLVYEDSETPEVATKNFEEICTYVSGTAKTAGAKYTCEVKEGTSYNFYVLTTPAEGAETINLIMDQNINSDGTPAGMTISTKNENNIYNLVEWISNQDYGCEEDFCAKNDKGPVTAMKFLYNATKDWTNIAPITYTYNDKKIQEGSYGYLSFVSTNGVATITPSSGDVVTIGTSDIPLRARIPIYSSDATKTEVANKTAANAYLYENLSCSKPYAYLTLSSRFDYSEYYIWTVFCDGKVDGAKISVSSLSGGVRPVITLKL